MKRKKKLTLQAVILTLVLVCSILFEIPELTSMDSSENKVKAANNPYPASQDVDGDGLYEVPCTRFAWQQVYDNLGIALPAWGNAGNWWNNAKNAGYATGNVPKAGSIAVWSGGLGHVAYVVSGAGNTFTVNEGGRTDKDQTASHGVVYGYTLTNAVGGRRPYDTGKILLGFIYPANADTESPVISNVRVEDVDDTGYTVLCDVTDNVGVVRVQFPSWPAYKRAEGCPWLEDHYVGNTFICRVKYSDFDNYKGLYHTAIYAWDAAGNCSNYGIVNANNPTKYLPTYTKADLVGNKKQVTANIIRNSDKSYVTIKNDGYLTVAKKTGESSQNWIIKNNGDGTVSIRSEKTGKYIGVYWGWTENGTKLDTADWNGTAPQRWIIYKDDDGTCYLRPSHVKNKVMDTGGDNGKTLHLWDFGRHAVHQTFKIAVVTDSSGNSPVAAPGKVIQYAPVSSAKKQLKLNWGYLSNANGYQIQYALNKNFNSAKTITISSNTILSRTITGLTSKKTYYTRVRAYKNSGNSKVYGSWSATKSCKVK